MIRIIVYLFALTSALSGYAQIDTTRKPVDTTNKPMDSTHRATDTTVTNVSLTDTVELHTDTANVPAMPRPQFTDNDDVEVYRYRAAVDLPITLAGTAISLYGFNQMYNKDKSPEATIRALKTSDINGFDRWAALKYSDKADKNSDKLFYGSMPLPFLLLLDKKIRKDAGKFALLYWETFSVTGIFYTGSGMLFDRYRPFVYNPNVPIEQRMTGNAKNSFIGGHPALVGTATFFMAKVYSDYHPESKVKWLFYTLAAGATGTTAYLRHIAGRHFPSDLLVGTTIGTLNGILMPHWHKNPILKKNKKASLTINPYTTGQNHGVVMLYRL